MNALLSIACRGAIAAVCLSLAGCFFPTGGSAPINYYALSARALPDPDLVSRQARLIGVQTVQLPDYLNQRPIVTRPHDNRIDVAELDQWAGNLGDSITNIIVENLTKLLGTESVVPLPVTAAVPVEDVVGIEIVNFERQPSDTVRLKARWIILGSGGRTFQGIHQSVYEADGVPADYASVASAMSDVLAAFSRDIAQTLSLPVAAPAPAVSQRPLG